MAKKQISTYKFVPGAIPPAYNQYPNAVALLAANKTFLIEEMDAYVRQQIAANNAPFVGYNYDATRSTLAKTYIGYFIDSLIYDLTYGGNSLTYQVAARYYLSGIIQTLTPAIEVATHTWLRGKITTNILLNASYTRINTTETQVILDNNAETAAVTLSTTLANYIINTINTGTSVLPTPVAPNTQGAGLMPNTVALLELNKRYVQEEAIAYIQYNVTNNISPYIYYTYNVEKCRRDISYILESYITDLKNGGNRQTRSNASKYWENGVAQVDGDRQPEIVAHTFIKNLIENYILTNIAFTSRQIVVNQVINFAKNLKPSKRGELEISDINKLYLNKNQLRVQLLPRGTAWLDTGTPSSLFDAASYIKVIQDRQGSKISCIEEIAFRNSWIDKRQLNKLADGYKNEYGNYLRELSI